MRPVWWLLLSLVLTACMVQPPVPEDRFYRLAEARPGVSLEVAALDGVLAVQAFAADGLHSERAMLYSTDPGQRRLQQYHYQFWLDAPPLLVQDYLAEYFRKAGIAGRVIEGYSSSSGAFHLSGRLKRFEQLLDGGRARVIAVLELRLERPGAPEPLLDKEYLREIFFTTGSVIDAVRGLEQALDGIAEEFIADVRQVNSARWKD